MTLLDHLRNAKQRPARPAGDPVEMATKRNDAYRELFEGDPIRIVPDADFERPAKFGGAVDIHLYSLEVQGAERATIAVTSGMSDYAMTNPQNGAPCRRELIQYLRQPRAEDLQRMHACAWLPLAQGFCLDVFHTLGPIPGTWPGALFVPTLVKPHAAFEMELNGDAVRLLWLVPLRQAEVDLRVRKGVNALLDRLTAVQPPWIFDENDRPPLV